MPNAPVNNLIVQKAGVNLTRLLAANGTSPVGAAIAADISNGLDLIGATWGEILFRGTAGWQVLGAGTAGKVLSTNGPGANPTWIAGGGGSGDVVGPGSAVDLTIAIFDGTTGKLIKDTAATILADGSMTLPVSVSGAGGGGLTVSNANTGSRANANFLNDAGVGGGFTAYGSAFPLPALQNNFSVYADNLLNFTSDGNTSTGGTHPIQFVAGGYSNVSTLIIKPGSPGRVLVGSVTDDNNSVLQVKDASMSSPIRMGFTSGLTTYGLLSFGASRTFAGGLGILGGDSGDLLNLYFIAPTSGSFQYFVNGAFVGSWSGDGIKTTAPSGSSAQTWKLGSIQAGAVTVDTTKSVFVDINGVVYKLIVAV